MLAAEVHTSHLKAATLHRMIRKKEAVRCCGASGDGSSCQFSEAGVQENIDSDETVKRFGGKKRSKQKKRKKREKQKRKGLDLQFRRKKIKGLKNKP